MLHSDYSEENILYTKILQYIDKCFCDRYKEYILSEFFIYSIKKNKNIARICLVPKAILSNTITIIKQLKVLSLGVIAGWIKNRSIFIPSIHLFSLARDEGFSHGCSVVAKPHGVKAFLYGNDLLVVSVDKFLYPIEKDSYVAVIDSEDMRVIGIGRLVVDPKDFEKFVIEGKILKPVVENVFDLGILLRNDYYI